MSEFKVGDYALYDDMAYGKREVKIEGQVGHFEFYLVSWHDKYEGHKQIHVRGNELSPVPSLAPQTPDMTPLLTVLQEVNAKEHAMVQAWHASVDTLRNPAFKTKVAIAAFKKAETEYIKALQTLHKAVKDCISA